MDAVIRTEELTKAFGKNRALSSLSLEVAPGEVFGYLGPNGAGKTTTIRLLLGMMRATLRARGDLRGRLPAPSGSGASPGRLRAG